MTASSQNYPITRSQEDNIVSVTKAMVETHVAENDIRIILIIIIKTTPGVHYTTETISKLTVTLMNFQSAGFH